MTPIQQIKAALPLNAYASQYLHIKANTALCPWHHEKTPSLKIYATFYKCHGCGESGDLITFASKYHSITTSAAIRLLASELNIPLTRQPTVHPYEAIKAQRLHDEAMEWRSAMRKNLIDSMNRSLQLQPAWKRHCREVTPWVKGMLPNIECTWERVDFGMPEDTDDSYDRILSFVERIDSMTRQQILTAYQEQRTPAQAAQLRQSVADHAKPTVESLMKEFLQWSR